MNYVLQHFGVCLGVAVSLRDQNVHVAAESFTATVRAACLRLQLVTLEQLVNFVNYVLLDLRYLIARNLLIKVFKVF